MKQEENQVFYLILIAVGLILLPQIIETLKVKVPPPPPIKPPVRRRIIVHPHLFQTPVDFQVRNVSIRYT